MSYGSAFFSLKECPKCGDEESFTVENEIKDIPYFGEAMQTAFYCDNCNFKRSDVMCLEEKPPMRHEYKISSEEDLDTRVVKSSTCTVEIPELDVEISPGPASEGYISNLEGIIRRVEEVLESTAEKVGPNKEGEAEELLERVGEIKSGETEVSIVLKDPQGHSSIPVEGAQKRELTEKEVDNLR